MDTDSAGNRFDEIEIPGGWVRVTYIEQGWANTPSVRIQIRESGGHLRQGPEIPIARIGDVVGAVIELLTSREEA